MPPLSRYGLATLLLLLALGSCKKEPVTVPDPCAPTSAVVKTVTATEGRVAFDTHLQQYVVVVSLPTALSSQDIGVLCTPLPAALQVNGLPVLFSGTYSAYTPAPSSGDLTYYQLSISSIAPK